MLGSIKRNKAVCIMLSFIMLFGFSIAFMAQRTNAASTEGFYVDGTAIKDAKGNEFVMRGVNHAYAWFNDTIETAMKASADMGANTVRIVLADGQQYKPQTSAEEVERLILMSMKYKVVPILEVHDATGKNDTASLNAAADYWIGIKDLLKKYEKYVIVNIANEWMGEWNNGSPWANAYKTAIQNMRDAGINNMIMVDAPGWGQDGPSCASYCKSVFDADPEKNTVFSIHMYGAAGKNASTIKNNIDGVLNKGVPVVIGEFGYKHTDGDVDEEYIMQYCTEKNVGYLGWSWKGNGGGVEYLDLSKDWAGTQLTDWGETLFNSENGIKKTSKVCSIYEDGSTEDISIPDISSDTEDTSSQVSDDSDSQSETDGSSSETDSAADTKDTSSDTSSASGTSKSNSGSGSSDGTTSVNASSGGTDSAANTGASALALVGIALAGAAIAVNKRK